MLAQYYRDYGPMMDGWDHTSWVSTIFGLFFFLFLVILVIYLLRALTGPHHTGHSNTHEPIDIARERYAKGELTKDEFAEIKKELK